MAKTTNSQVRVLYKGRSINSISMTEAINRVRRGEARPVYRKKRMVAIQKFVTVKEKSRDCDQRMPTGQKLTYRHETASNPPNVHSLKRVDKFGAFVAA